MTEPLDRIGRVGRATSDRRDGTPDRRGAEPVATGGALVPAEPLAAAAPAEDRRSGLSEFFAQLLGQGARRRGLKGGQPVLDEARSTYLGAEYSGPADRRPKPGKINREV